MGEDGEKVIASFQNYSALSKIIAVLFSMFPREKYSRYFTLSKKDFFNKFSLKESLALETSGGILLPGTECKFCRKYGKMFWAG